jgi:hypothetical protein
VAQKEYILFFSHTHTHVVFTMCQALPSALQVLAHQSHKNRNHFTFAKTKHRQSNGLAQSHTARKWESLEPGLEPRKFSE